MVTVLYGANGGSLEGLAGQSVGQIRGQFTGAFGIPSDAQAQVNGETAAESRVLTDGDELQFVKATASKG